MPAPRSTSHQGPIFIYYKLYDDDKKEMIPCQRRIATDPCIGRVDAWQIPAPYTINELVGRICKQENRPCGLDWDNDHAHGSMLLRTVNSSEAYNLSDTVDLLGAEHPGSTPQEPVLLKLWYEDLQAVLGSPGWEQPVVRSVASHRNPVFIYYKLYDDDKKQMIPCRSGNTEDPCVGRVDTCQIPTPHTIGALAHHICTQENRPSGFDWDIDHAHGSMLLRTVNSSEAYDLSDAVDLLGAERPGSTPQEPVLLKLWNEDLQVVLGLPGWEKPVARSVASHRNPVFIYYKLYNDDKKQMIPCRTGNTEDPCVGRVDTCQIPTPHTISALAHHICTQENRPSGFDWDTDGAHGTMLLRTANSSEAYDLSDAVDLMGADRPGSTPQEPVLLKLWYEELQAVFGLKGWERPVERSVTSHLDV
ncbi:hypothetical protein C8R44DRAFT_883448 [Mycena epipterygia]|nr:hypothetical protein C8R44DRAFT_883448 [Mycena epipterygia]